MVARVCEVCGVDISQEAERYQRCTNGRCGHCHRRYCTPGGSDSPGHGRGDIATPYSAEAIRSRNRETVTVTQ